MERGADPSPGGCSLRTGRLVLPPGRPSIDRLAVRRCRRPRPDLEARSAGLVEVMHQSARTTTPPTPETDRNERTGPGPGLRP